MIKAFRYLGSCHCDQDSRKPNDKFILKVLSSLQCPLLPPGITTRITLLKVQDPDPDHAAQSGHPAGCHVTPPPLLTAHQHLHTRAVSLHTQGLCTHCSHPSSLFIPPSPIFAWIYARHLGSNSEHLLHEALPGSSALTAVH